MSRLLRLTTFVLALSFSATALAGNTEDQRAQNALRVLNDIQAIPESAIPDKLLDEAKAIVVVPDSLKIGLVLGGRSGHGLLSVKTVDGVWSNPVFVQLTGGSIGFQAGVQSSDIVLVFTSERGLESIVNGKVTLGADASIAAGPIGRNTSLATDGGLKAEIWSWSRSRGLFAGVALDGAVLRIDDKANQVVYGAGSTPRMIFEDRTQQRGSNDVVAFRDQLEEATAAARMTRGTTGRPAPTAMPQAPASTTQTPPVSTQPAQQYPQQGAPQQAMPHPDMQPPMPQPQPFEPVDSTAPPADTSTGDGTRIEPLP